MEDKLITLLKTLSLIEPDEASKVRSRSRIVVAKTPTLSRVRTGFFESMKLGTAMALASVLLFIIVGGFSYFKLTSVATVASSSFDFKTLSAEAANIDLRVQLGEAEYFDDSARQMATVLNDVSETATDEEINKLLEEIVL